MFKGYCANMNHYSVTLSFQEAQHFSVHVSIILYLVD